MTHRPDSGPGDRGRRRPRSGPPRRPATQRPPADDPARSAALELLAAVRERDAYANLTLPTILAQRRLSGRDAALATELAYGTCRMLGQLDAVLAACGDRSLADLDGTVLDALRLGGYQLLHTRVPSHAAVSATVDLVRAGQRPRAAGYVNAVLRRVSEVDLGGWIEHLAPVGDTDPLSRLALATAHPRWIVAALSDALAAGGTADVEMAAGGTAVAELAGDGAAAAGAVGSAAQDVSTVGDAARSGDFLDEAAGIPSSELAGLLAADNRPPGVHLVARPGLIDRAELVGMADGEPGRFSPLAVYLPGGDPARLAAVAQHRAAVQDEGSQLVALAVANAHLAGRDCRWLDLTAGPGGKAALWGAIAMARGASVDAVEVASHRADLVRRTTAGLPVTVHTADGRDPGLELAAFDRVLLDAPCTGLGALRRRPEARWRRTERDVAPLVKLQRELLMSAARLVRPGGLIGYVTCSPHLAETVGVIARRPDGLELVDARPFLPQVPALGAGPTVQLWPHRHGTDGMFLALLRRAC